MNIVKNMFNTRALVIYLSMISICSLAMGFLVDWLYAISDIQPSVSIGQAAEIIPYPVKLISVLILTALMIYNGRSNMKPAAKHTPSKSKTDGMGTGLYRVDRRLYKEIEND